MNEIGAYLERVRAILCEAEKSQAAVMEKAARVLAAAVAEKHSIWTFGTGHAGIIAMERYYRTGGLALVNYLPAPGLVMDVTPPTLTTAM